MQNTVIPSLDQKNNYIPNFGHIYRSSGIFFCPKNIKTTISVLNYFKFKNNNNVSGLITSRELSGEIISRNSFNFEDNNVLNFSFVHTVDRSVEIEFFSIIDLRIPYAAVMAIYESEESVSMVHNYSRNHSLIEIEDQKCHLAGEETCWFISESSRLQLNSFKGVFHNGHVKIPNYQAKLVVTQSGCDDFVIDFEVPQISAYATHIFDLNKIIDSADVSIKSGAVWFRISFKSLSSFPRLLLTEESKNGEFQVTHSDIDYEKVGTDFVYNSMGHTKIPHVLKTLYSPLLEVDPGVPTESKLYYLDSNGVEKDIDNGAVIKVRDQDGVAFGEREGKLPSRIHTATSGYFSSKNNVPFRSCLGVVHKNRPTKHTHWVPFKPGLNSTLHITDYREYYKQLGPSIELNFKLFNSSNNTIIEKKIEFASIEIIPNQIKVSEIFDEKSYLSLDSKEFAYLLINSNYGGFFMFMSLCDNKSFTIEHTF